MFENKKILITGGTGSIGIELLHELLKYEPAAVRILDIDETKQFELQQEFGDYGNIRFLLGDIRDKERLHRAIEDIDIIFHTAALKHVLACEYNPFEAVKTNVIGIQNLIDVAMDEEVEKVIFTSSDKAVNPTNVMGATKLLAERLVTSANYYKGARKTMFSSVRFGNVLGSRGSVIPLFKKQIEHGGPVTITNNEMTRFIMPMQEAIDLLFKATGLAQRGEIFVFKMKALKITDLAEVMIEELAQNYDYSRDEIKMEIIGNKLGEKLYEELMTEDEARRALEGEDLFIVLPDMKELSDIDKSYYPLTSQAEIKAYNSKDEEHLSKAEIKEILYQENLIEVVK
ncbi:MAG: SDR family NAD(P)-dependent oxidoreductase [Methanophagales archaeon]|nr:SDR family NAD(P)-dependent oxidoreductase [Methanophagales archaeon]